MVRESAGCFAVRKGVKRRDVVWCCCTRNDVVLRGRRLIGPGPQGVSKRSKAVSGGGRYAKVRDRRFWVSSGLFGVVCRAFSRLSPVGHGR